MAVLLCLTCDAGAVDQNVNLPKMIKDIPTRTSYLISLRYIHLICHVVSSDVFPDFFQSFFIDIQKCQPDFCPDKVACDGRTQSGGRTCDDRVLALPK